MNAINQLLTQEKLSATFEETVLPHYAQLADNIAAQHQQKKQPLLVAVNGAQGTGKSTLALFLQAFLQDIGKRVAVFSIDDLYLTYQSRQQLAKDVHPLFKTRGVPGTHDLTLGQTVIDALLKAEVGEQVKLPAFDKAQDDRKPQADWPHVTGSIDIIILEGWCVGATAMPKTSLDTPVNQLEAEEDADQLWRRTMNDALATDYQAFFNQFDLLVMLKAPSFDSVKAWRTLQEEKLARKMQVTLGNEKTTNNGALNAPFKGLMDSNALNRFMMHYERLTTHMLNTMPQQANVLIALAQDHSIQQVTYRGMASHD